ncbi:hypothetical protein CDG77_24765 [Nostoc sp. 'Peltigera membranacea cyanobiont' 213]|uniref:mannan-binding lectin n=1 Tax=Nostoc cyanobionts TaxID=3123326 RepID=UPI000B956B4D|nr:MULTISPECIES: mannan-binding lectin [unclassified Nostoc]OYD88246.1 hypothetical protein CDG77_24765 [Nostoc sp. 'Peltigera membranacea cyanobiont' 213]OYE00545.1 hypothetical protein CDG79_34550 [Nostoc sp. 'Peltigera membranacea cyanobiont' 232]
MSNTSSSLMKNKFLLTLTATVIGGSAIFGFANLASAGDVSAGPIWSNEHAKQVCPQVCSSVGLKWDGNWYTNVPGKNSVCSCVSK